MACDNDGAAERRPIRRRLDDRRAGARRSGERDACRPRWR